MYSKRVEMMAVELSKGEVETLENTRKIIDGLIRLMDEMDNVYSRLLCLVGNENDYFVIDEIKDTAYTISAICNAYRIES